MKTKLLVTADRHKPNDRTRLSPWYEANKKIVEIARELKVNAVLDVGDSGVDCRGSQEAQHCDIVSLIRPLAVAGIDYVCIDGNHDRRGASETEVTINSWLGTIKDEDLWRHVHYRNSCGPMILEYPGQIIRILPLPYPPKHLFALGKDIKGAAEITTAASEFLLSALNGGLDLLKAYPGDPAVVMFHGTIDCPTLQLGGERTMPCGHEIHLPIDAFPAWDNMVVACGHIHVRQILSKKPFIFYPGNLVPSQHDNEDQEPGVMLLEFEDGKFVGYEFIPIKTVQYKTVKINLEEIAAIQRPGISLETEQEIEKSIESQYAPDERVRTTLRVQLTNAQSRVVDSALLTEKLIGLGFQDVTINKVKAEERTLSEVRDAVKSELGMTHEEHVREYIKRMPEAQRIIEAAGIAVADVLAADAGLREEVGHVVG